MSNPFKSNQRSGNNPFQRSNNNPTPLAQNPARNASAVFGNSSGGGRNPFSSSTNNKPNPFASGSSSNRFVAGSSQFSVGSKETRNEKQLEVVMGNFYHTLNPESEENRFKEYVFNRFPGNLKKDSIIAFKERQDTIPFDEKYNRVRKENPDEDKFYIHPVLNIGELYQRKNQLNETMKRFIKDMKDSKAKMQEFTSMWC